MLEKIIEIENQIEALKREVKVLKNEYKHSIRFGIWYKMRSGTIFFKPEYIENDYMFGTSLYLFPGKLACIENDDSFYLYSEEIKDVKQSTYDEMHTYANTHNYEILKQYK